MSDKQLMEQAYRGFALLDAKADAWAEEVSLTTLISETISPLLLNNDEMRNRVEERIYSLVRQAFQEGALAGVAGLDNERDRLRALGLD